MGVWLVLLSGGLLFGKGLLGPCADQAGGNRPAVHRTEHFDIIYDMDRPEAAIAVSEVCEQSYAEIEKNLDVDLDLRLPVVVTPRKNSLNAYFTSFPYNRIAVFDTPPYAMELESLEKGVAKIFHHELSHAISLNIRGPMWDFIAGLLGPWVNPGLLLYQNQGFAEGLAVAFESLGGGGRLDDPYCMELLVQGKLEGRHPGWIDIAGSRDIRPIGGLPYLYGGAFAGHLIKKYGIKKWSDFVKSSAAVGWRLLPGKFKKTYHIGLGEEFDAFLLMVPSAPEASDLGEDLLCSSSLAALGFAGRGLWLSDPGRGRVVIVDPQNGQVQSTTVIQSYEPEICYSEDGTIKAFSIINDDEVKTVVEWPEGRREHKNLRRPCIVGGRLAGVSNSGSSQSVRVFDLAGGRMTDELALPWPWNAASLRRLDDRTLLLVLSNGKRWEVGALDLDDMELRLVENPDSIQIRTLGPSDDGGIVFSYFYPEAAGNLSRYGEFVFNDGVAERRLSPMNISGGVHNPAKIDGKVFFIGRFFDEDRLRAVPERVLDLGEMLSLRLAKTDLEGESVLAEDFISSSEPYDPFSYFKRGSVIPAEPGPARLVGLSYITSDPAENYVLNIGAGRSLELDIVGASLVFADSSWRLLPLDINNAVVAGWGLGSRAPFLMWRSGLATARTRWGYGSDLEIRFQDNRIVAGWSNRVKFFTYRPMGKTPFEHLGCEAGLGVDFLFSWGTFQAIPVLGCSLSLPRLLPFENRGAFVLNFPSNLNLGLRVGADPVLEGSARIVLLDWEVQKGLGWLSLYVRRIYLSAEGGLTAWLASGRKDFCAKFLVRSDWAPVLGLALQNLGLSFFIGVQLKAGKGVDFVCGLDSSLFQ